MLLVTGGRGQLGNTLAKFFPDAIFTDKDDLDITDYDKVREFVEKNKIDTVINCAAYTAVDKAEDEPELAEKINVLGTLNLTKTIDKIIHISTDYVFDGKGGKPYTEEDKTSPLSVYGKTKAMSENAVLLNAKTGIVIRTSWLYSEFQNNFVKTMKRLGAEKESINVVFDQVGSPTCAIDLAETIFEILPKIKEKTTEIYHFSNEGVCSWYDFALEIMDLSGLKCKVNPILSKDYKTKAIRPSFSVLDKTKIKTDFNITIPHWKESLKECLKQF